eukprot:TRINITY_DN19471_c0_g1_i1.p1 TRINITY_DN19471_c0_g1~~TRINITY_DN19471_c0_g1_i1.p1  ORF type:complete len:180 (-),score=27.52 TRINITY_DN19471_c0_g1_i1:98-637(-)
MSEAGGRIQSAPANASLESDSTVPRASDECSQRQDLAPDIIRLEAALESEDVGEGAHQDNKGRSDDGNEGAAENAEEEECGFCLFMKSGPCGKRFSLWEECVEDAETIGDNIVEKCWQTTQLLKQCMEMNPEYYGPVLQAEKSLQEEKYLLEDSPAEGNDSAKPQTDESEGREEQYAAA